MRGRRIFCVGLSRFMVFILILVFVRSFFFGLFGKGRN